jgi:hypothetical protein
MRRLSKATLRAKGRQDVSSRHRSPMGSRRKSGPKVPQIVIASPASMILGSLPTVRAGTVTYNFNDGTLDGLVVAGESPGFSYNVSGGQLNVNAAAGSGNGGVSFETPFDVTGDFTATVVASWTALPSGGDLVLNDSDSDIFFYSGTAVNSNIDGSSRTTNSISNTSTDATFEMIRTGDTVTTYYDTGGGFTEVASRTDSLLAGSTPIGIFLDQELGNDASEAGSFDNLSITSASVPNPASISIASLGTGGLLLRRRRT